MIHATLSKLNKTLTLQTDRPLMPQLLEEDIPVASSCGGDGICGKCIVTVTPQGAASHAKTLETETLKKIQAEPNQRLSCQLYCLANIEVQTTYW